MGNSLHYNYVVFNIIEGKIHKNPYGYYTICCNDLDGMSGVENVWAPLHHKSTLIKLFFNIHSSRIINKHIKLPFQQFWYPYYFHNKFSENKPLCFVLIGRLSLNYLRYLKSKYPNCRLVLLYRDLRMVTEQLYPDLPDNPIFDLQMTIDRREAKKYGWCHFEEFESKIDVPISKDYPESDVFFAGKAKDRLSRLMKAYDIFTNAGLRCKYFLTGVSKADQIEKPGIEYSDRFMPYTEMLYHTVNSKCVLEINQAQAVGYTSRFLEAVMFNKRLITDNQDVKTSIFYNDSNIQCISNIEDVSPAFVMDPHIVDYHYKDEFSPVHLIEQIDNELVERYGK